MGQYRLWLHHREADQQLRGKLAALEQELLILQQQTRLLEHTAVASYSDNTIIQALLTHHTQQAERLLAQASVRLGTAPLPAYRPESASEPRATTSPELPVTLSPGRSEAQRGVSSALQAWGGLPNLSMQDIQGPSANTEAHSPQILPTNQQEHLLPEDISAFVDGYSLTDPRIKLPWWLRNAVQPEQDAEQGQNPVDQQSLRTNRLVQRWFDRWGQREEQAQEDGQAR